MFLMHNRDAIVFDLDGTLTDTEKIWDIVRSGLAAEDGVPWPDDATDTMMGMSTQEWSAYLADVIGLHGSADDARRRTLDGMIAEYRRHLPVMDGAVEALRRLHSRYPLGLASSSARVLIDEAIKVMGVADLFAVTLSSEEIGGAGKPAPDVYLEACRLLGVEPGHAIGVEDSPGGIRSVRAAGMRVVAIPPAFHPPSPDVLELADVVLNSLDDLTLPLAAQLLAQA